MPILAMFLWCIAVGFFAKQWKGVNAAECGVLSLIVVLVYVVLISMAIPQASSGLLIENFMVTGIMLTACIIGGGLMLSVVATLPKK
jgi:hypothetical protein